MKSFNRTLAFISYATALACFIPFLLVLAVATTSDWRSGLWAEGLTSAWLGAAWERLSPQLLYSLQLALNVLSLNILIGLPAAWAVARLKFPGRQVLISINALPLAIPGIAVALALILTYPGQYTDWRQN